MTLVGEAGFLSDQREGLVGLAQQVFCTLDPALDDIALRPNSGRSFEGAAKVVGAEARISASTVSERSSSRCASI